MATLEVCVERLSATSSNPFCSVVAAFEAAIGHPAMASFDRKMADAKTSTELEATVLGATGASELMEFTHMALGAVLARETERQYQAACVSSPPR